MALYVGMLQQGEGIVKGKHLYIGSFEEKWLLASYPRTVIFLHFNSNHLQL